MIWPNVQDPIRSTASRDEEGPVFVFTNSRLKGSDKLCEKVPEVQTKLYT